MAARPRDPGVYSRWVGILKIGLPLIAVGLLSTVFLVQREDTFEGGLVFTKVDLATLGDGLTISNPRFSGLTDAGDTFTLSAARAVPDSSRPKIVEMTDISADYSQSGGMSVTATAAQGVALMVEQTLELAGGLTALTNTDYEFNAEGGLFDLRSGAFESAGQVRIIGPGQQLIAGKMRVTTPDNGDNQIFLFENGVRMTYDPQAAQN